MPLWFEIAVLVFLGCIAVSLIDLCFCFENMSKNLSALVELVGRSAADHS
jgi:hypothetical protein